jgi:hypothetical protein
MLQKSQKLLDDGFTKIKFRFKLRSGLLTITLCERQTSRSQIEERSTITAPIFCWKLIKIINICDTNWTAGPIFVLKIGQNIQYFCWKLVQIGGNWSKVVKIAENWSKVMKVGQNSWKLLKIPDNIYHTKTKLDCLCLQVESMSCRQMQYWTQRQYVCNM